MTERGTILIVTTWILAILTLFAIGIGFRTGLEIKLTGYDLSKIKATYIAKAGIRKAIAEKWQEYAEGKSLGVDAFSESWANNKEYFNNIKVGSGSFTLEYNPGEADRSGREIILYGLEDEGARININSDKSLPILRNLLLGFGLELEAADSIVAAIEDWRDENSTPKLLGEISSGTEDAYYQTLPTPYVTSGRPFGALEELLLLKGMTNDLFYKKLMPLITIYGDTRVNINTARKETLDALLGVGYPDLAAKIVDYRKGTDGRIGTDDDRWFSKGEFVIERGERGLVEVKDLNDETWYGNIFGITDPEYKRLQALAGKDGLLSTSSDYYRASVKVSAGKTQRKVDAVIMFNKPPVARGEGFSEEMRPPDVTYLYWHEGR